MESAPPRDIILLGSTGSIGTQAADIVRRNPGRFRLTGLAAGGGNPGLLAGQALEFGVDVVAVAGKDAAGAVGAGAFGPGHRPARGCPRWWPARTRWRSWPRASVTWC